MGKKVLIIGIIVIVVAALIGGSIFAYNKFKNKKDDNTVTINETINIEEYYGKRGKITETERVSFLIKAEDLIVGMMALAPNTEETPFSENDMIKFALYVAQERYSDMLESKKNYKTGEYEYYINPDVISSIIQEFFGRSDIEFSYDSDDYNYSSSNKKFIFNQDIQKTLWYYPVSQETTEDRIVITVDSVYINEDQADYSLREAKYEGRYEKDKVDSTIKFIYNTNGYLVAYQYVGE
ncbi:MAG: hypothetical protein IKG42_03045 [Clostridia bacterium]|nr:hypothetical protein [Clostridia bacterium]